jgi:uncharacterized protein YfiM (DUF2279 family)
MRLGVGQLLLAIACTLARLYGDQGAANLLAMAYLAAATYRMGNSRNLRAATSTARYLSQSAVSPVLLHTARS